jgi:hypothetical protein
MNRYTLSEVIPDEVLSDALAPGCAVPGKAASAAMLGSQSLENFADELGVLMRALSEKIGTADMDVMHRIAERARATAAIVGIIHRREMARSSRAGGTFRSAEPFVAAEE